MVYAGVISLYVALGLTMYSIQAGIFSKGIKGDRKIIYARKATTLSVVAIAVATLLLVQAFIVNDFRFAYVVRNSQRSLPLIYKISALWSGQSGSLLLWLLIISVLALVVQTNKKLQEQELDVGVNVVVNLMRLLFLVLLIFVTSPFEQLTHVPWDGNGLNPMLQSFGMVIHPPLLFMGFSGFFIPFAIVVTGLWKRTDTGTWLRSLRLWVLFSWVFLTAGIITGGQWAYTELGWGGYWGWDPVENASLLPWFTSTALIHTLLLPKDRKHTRVWSFVLMVATFSLTIFSTYLTRSGILDSVHAFSGGILGHIFLGVLALILLFSFYLGWSRREQLGCKTQEQVSDGWLSKRAFMQMGNILLLLLCVGVFLATMFPLFSRLFLGREVVLDSDFYNQLTVPLFLVVFILMALSPILDWKTTSISPLSRKLMLPSLGLIGVVFYSLIIKKWVGVASFSFAIVAFAVIAHLQDLASSLSKRKLGAFCAHLGAFIILVGVTGSSVFVDDVFLSLQPGGQTILGDYVLEYPGVKTRYGSDRYAVGTTLTISRDDKEVGKLTSEKTFWENRKQPSTRVGIYSTFKEDLYLNLAGWENQTAQLHLQRFALVRWIWIGSLVIYLGVLVLLLPSKIPSTKNGR